MKGHILILTANILFGVSMPVFKFLLTSDFPPEAITYMRAAFACVMFWIVSFFVAPQEKVLPKELGLLAVCGLCGVGFNQWLFVTGLKSSSPVDASIIATAVPIFVLLLASVILKEPISAKKSLGVLMGVSGGLLLVYSSAHRAGDSSIKGDVLMLLNQLLYSVYLVLSKPLSLRYSSITVMKWMFLFSTVALTPFCLQYLQQVPVFHRETFDGTELYALLYLLLGATFLSFMLIPMALKYIRPTTVSMYNYVQPIVASLIAISIGQDTFSLQKLASAVLVFVGVWLVTKSKKRENIEKT